MTVTVLLREPMRSRAGTGRIELDLLPDDTLGALLAALCARYPVLGSAGDLRAQNEFFIGDSYVPRGEILTTPLHNGETVLVAVDVAGG
jgi:molybdopterin converting factor small subunit